MTTYDRFKELRRIKAAIEHKNEDELRWALEYCKMRVGIAGQFSKRAAQEKHWSKVQTEVEKAPLELKERIDSNL